MMRYIQLSDLAWYGNTFILELRECNGARKPVSLNQQRIVLQLRCGTYMKEVENCLENLGADIRAARVNMKWLWGVVNDMWLSSASTYSYELLSTDHSQVASFVIAEADLTDGTLLLFTRNYLLEYGEIRR